MTLAGAAGGWMQDRATVHALALFVWAIITATIILIGLRLRGTDRAKRLNKGVGLFALAAYIAVNIYWMWPGNLVWDKSLPIQLCDLAALCAPIALLTRSRTARALLYFWGLGLSTQGFITPVNEHGPESGEFWMHWLNHGAIVGAAMFDLTVLRFRPQWRDWRTAVLLGVVYLACVFVLNIITGWNYGYVGATKPDVRTLVDFLGPWPLRVVWIALIGITAMALLMVPWEVARRLTRSPDVRE